MRLKRVYSHITILITKTTGASSPFACFKRTSVNARKLTFSEINVAAKRFPQNLYFCSDSYECGFCITDCCNANVTVLYYYPTTLEMYLYIRYLIYCLKLRLV